MNFPLRALLALVVIGAFGAIAAWALISVLRATSLTEAQRMIAAGIIMLVIALLIMGGIFGWPTY